MTAPANLLAEWAGLLLTSLHHAGIVDVVISPGSRSTPFVLAAAKVPGLRLHDVIDERAAAFFALGQARVTGRPSLLLCTSGTAGAHYLPAVIEASAAHVPLLVLTADRPFELQDCGAPQTIDQRRLYGDHVRRHIELGTPDESASALRGLRRAAHQAVLATRWPTPGAVHLNARARKPLEPRPDDGDAPEARALTAVVHALLATPLAAYVPTLQADRAGVAALAGACRRATRGVIVCGPAPLDDDGARTQAVRALAAATGFPLLIEATSQLRFTSAPLPDGVVQVGGFDALLHNPAARAAWTPDLVVQLGAAPTSSGLDALLAGPDADASERFVVAADGWLDPHGRAHVLIGDIAQVARDVARDVAAALGADAASDAARAAWRSRWSDAERDVWRAVDGALAATAWCEGAVVRATAATVTDGALLMIGNSLPIRELDTFVPPALRRHGVLCQRGANGIDGLIAGAAGAASTGRATTLILGDISALHDVGGLATAGGPGAALVVVVINNDGGRIFEQLPIANAGAGTLRHFTTPHGRTLAPAVALWGHAFHAVDDLASLGAALARARDHAGCTVIEARVPPSGAAAMHADLWRHTSTIGATP